MSLINRLIGVCAAASILLVSGTVQATAAVQHAQQAPVQIPVVRQIAVSGNQRVEPETISSYLSIRVGDQFKPELLDDSLKRLHATGLFSDIEFIERNGALIIRVVENPIINRIIFEGNKKLDREDFNEEIRLRPRQVFTRAKVRADVQRMLTLYQRKGRFAAVIEPKVVQQEQNRVDLVFEIQEGPKSRIGKINFIGNKKYSDGELRDILASKESRWWKFFTSNDTFDPDRLAYDQQVLREFYLNEGYADFRTISAVAELTPDRNDFLINLTVEEGEIYEFGEIKVDSDLRDVKSEFLQAFVGIREGQIYNAERIEQTIEGLQGLAGQLGYAFVDVRPNIQRDRENRKIAITFNVLDAPRVYVERINITGNVRTLDRVIRREFRLQEGDAFNSALVDRSETRLNRLNFFRTVEVEQTPGSEEDRIILDVAVEEQATGQLNVGAGFSSVDSFIFNLSVEQSNLLGKGQQARVGLSLSGRRQDINLSFTEPYFMGRRVSAGADVFYSHTDNSRFGRGSSFSFDQIGAGLRLGAAISEYWTISTRYQVSHESTDAPSLVNNAFTSLLDSLQPFEGENALEYLERIDDFDMNNDGIITDSDFDRNGDGLLSENERLFGQSVRFRESFGSRVRSVFSYSLATDSRNSYIRPTRGRLFRVTQDIAGLGGDVAFVRTSADFDQYWTPIQGWTFRASAEGGIVEGLGQSVRLTDRFFKGGPDIRGFDNAGMGPRDLTNNIEFGQPLGGTAYYIGRAELFFPLGELALESGVAASLFLDAGSTFRAQSDLDNCQFGRKEWENVISGAASFDTLTGGNVCVAGNEKTPRISAGVGVSWQSPFGPFRIDLATIIKAQAGDQTQSLQFNVGTAF